MRTGEPASSPAAPHLSLKNRVAPALPDETLAEARRRLPSDARRLKNPRMAVQDEGEKYVDGRGELVVRTPAPGVLLFVESGYLVASRAEIIQRALDAELRKHGRLTIFVDGEHLQGYDPPIRTVPTDWLKQHAAHVQCQHMLVRGQIAKMGLAVAGLVLGAVIQGHTDRRAFDLALRDAVRAASNAHASTQSSPPQ